MMAVSVRMLSSHLAEAMGCPRLYRCGPVVCRFDVSAMEEVFADGLEVRALAQVYVGGGGALRFWHRYHVSTWELRAAMYDERAFLRTLLPRLRPFLDRMSESVDNLVDGPWWPDAVCPLTGAWEGF